MIQIQPKADALAVTLSVLCILHCLLLPVIVIAMPSVGAFFFADEAFHIWMVVAVIPVSAIALYSGWKEHKLLKVAILGLIGLLTLTCAAFLGHDMLPESWELSLTVIGTLFITSAHIWNYFLWKVELVDEDDEIRTF